MCQPHTLHAQPPDPRGLDRHTLAQWLTPPTSGERPMHFTQGSLTHYRTRDAFIFQTKLCLEPIGFWFTTWAYFTGTF